MLTGAIIGGAIAALIGVQLVIDLARPSSRWSSFVDDGAAHEDDLPAP